jgi:transposase-like protein
MNYYQSQARRFSMGKRRTFSPVFKADRVLEVGIDERTTAEICREQLLSPQQVSGWYSRRTR